MVAHRPHLQLTGGPEVEKSSASLAHKEKQRVTSDKLLHRERLAQPEAKATQAAGDRWGPHQCLEPPETFSHHLAGR